MKIVLSEDEIIFNYFENIINEAIFSTIIICRDYIRKNLLIYLLKCKYLPINIKLKQW